MGQKDNDPAISLVRWLLSTAVAGVSMGVTVVVFAYGNFESKEHAKEVKDDIKAELHQINAKLDMIYGMKPGSWSVKTQ